MTYKPVAQLISEASPNITAAQLDASLQYFAESGFLEEFDSLMSISAHVDGTYNIYWSGNNPLTNGSNQVLAFAAV